MIYEDKEDGFRFEYPAFLDLDDTCLTFHNPDDSNELALGIALASKDPGRFPGETEIINGMNWVKFSFPRGGGAGYAIYHNYEEASIEGTVQGTPAKPLSSGELQAMRQMVATFAFAPLSSRMDSKIAALKIGQKFGSVHVGHVVTRAMANGNRKKYWTNPLGEVDFAGPLTLTAHISDQRSMNSGPQWVIGAVDTIDCSKLPQIAYPIDCKKLPYLQIRLNNPDFVARQMKENAYPDDVPLTIVVDHLIEVYYPGGGFPSFSANLVKASRAR